MPGRGSLAAGRCGGSRAMRAVRRVAGPVGDGSGSSRRPAPTPERGQDARRVDGTERPPHDDRRRSAQATVEQGLAAARAIVIVPVVVLVLAALGAFAYGAYWFGHSAVRIGEHPARFGGQIGLFLVVVDVFLSAPPC